MVEMTTTSAGRVQAFWRALLPEILALGLLTLVLSVLLIWWSQQLAVHHHAQQQASADAADRVRWQQQQTIYANWLATHAETVTRWQAAGWLSAEGIAQWASRWSSVTAQEGLVDVRYEFSALQACTPNDWPHGLPCPSITTALPQAMQVSHLQVQFLLPDGRGLQAWLQAFAKHTGNMPVLRQCDWSPQSPADTSVTNPISTQALAVTCRWDWFYLPIHLPGIHTAHVSSTQGIELGGGIAP